MNRIARVGKVLVLTAAICVLAFGALTAWGRPPGPRCECADLDAPVICKGGKVYSNPCVAACFGATGCVPYGGGGGVP